MKTPKKIALIGFDCAVTPLVRRHIAEGICPNFKKVLENGTVAENCLAPFPTITPPNWTTMATGANPGTNDITDFWRHIPGSPHGGVNTHNVFNWEHVKAESIWEAIDKIGKKSIIFNFPMSYNVHKKLKNAIVAGGAGLSVGVFQDQEFAARTKGIERTPATPTMFSFCDDTMISTEVYPGNSVRIVFKDASDWKNVSNMGEEPLDCSFEMVFGNSIYDALPQTWNILVRDMGDGYNTVTLSSTKDFNDAFFTIKTNEWSKAFEPVGRIADGRSKKLHMRAKMISMDSDDATSFKLYLSAALNKDGEQWIYPQEKAKLLNHSDNYATNNTGFYSLTMGYYDYDTWLEIIGIHYDWLAESAIALMQDTKDWSLYYSHAHPTDHIYHALMTELDENTCSSEAMYKKAWELHATLYKHADRYLGRLLEQFDDDTLVCLISDHGATPDGFPFDSMKILQEAGLTTLYPPTEMKWLEKYSENIRPMFAALGQQVDPSKTIAIPERCCYVYINLKGREPGGIVEPEDYEATQRKICDVLMSYVDPVSGKKPVCLALPKEEAKLLGLWGEQVGDVVYAIWPEFHAQHGPILPSTHFGQVGEMRPLCVFYGAGIKKGYSLERVCSLIDLVPTFCTMAGWPIPETTEGAVIYQIMDKNS